MSADISAGSGIRIYRAAVSDRLVALLIASAVIVCAFEVICYLFDILWTEPEYVLSTTVGYCIAILFVTFIQRSAKMYVCDGKIHVTNIFVDRALSPEQIGRIVVGRPVHRPIVRDGFRFRRLPDRESSVTVRTGRFTGAGTAVIGSEDLLREIIETVPDADVIRK